MILSYNVTKKEEDSSTDSIKEEDFNAIETIMKQKRGNSNNINITEANNYVINHMNRRGAGALAPVVFSGEHHGRSCKIGKIKAK